MSGGGVIIARSLWDDPVFQDKPFSEREAWIWMICEAAWKPRQKRVGKVIVDLDRGQFAASVRFMAKAFSWHRSKVDRLLKRLEKCNSIRAESGTGVNVITICKYDEYQLSPKSNGTAARQQRDSSGTNENKGNKVIKDTNVSLGKKRKPELPLPEGWVPDIEKARRVMEEYKLNRDEMNFCYKAMEAHAHANDRRQRDWDAAYRNWVVREIGYGNIGPNSKKRKQSTGQSSIWD